MTSPAPRAEAPPHGTWCDHLGIGLSGLCAVHCLVMPVLLAVVPLWSAAGTLHHWLHPALAVLVVPVSLAALVAGVRARRPGAVGLLGAGLAVVVGVCLAGQTLPGTYTETALSLGGSLLLIAGHRANTHCGGAHPH